MIINRGQADDFNSSGRSAATHAGLRRPPALFKLVERRIGGGDDLYRGRDGNIPVTDLDWPHEICEAFLDGANGLGVPRDADYNGASQPGCGSVPRSIHKGLRRSAAAPISC